MAKNKVVDLEDFRAKKAMQKQLEELDRLGREQDKSRSPAEKKGYHNFMKLLNAVDKKHSPDKDK